MPHLEAYGYGEFFSEQMARFDDELVAARVVGQHRRQWDVLTDAGSARAVLAGRRWRPGFDAESADVQPTIGDWVALRRGQPPVIEHVLKRRTWLARTSNAKRGAKQVLAANIDVIAVVAAFAHENADDFAARRSLNPRRLERYLTAIGAGGAKPLVLLNKADLQTDADDRGRELSKRLGACPVLAVNCAEEHGLQPLTDRLVAGETVGFIGLSGVGKSSIVNRILGRDVQKVRAERTSDARGRHTTTHRELFLSPGGLLLIDTPGMREFALIDADESDLEAFSDVLALSRKCQFRDCRHSGEPGCEVRRGVESGELSQDRVESFQSLRAELDEQARNSAARTRPARNHRKPARKSGRGSRKGENDPWDLD